MTPRSNGAISFEVRALPVPQGSSRAFVIKGRARITSDNRNLRSWRNLVATVAQAHAPPALWDAPIAVQLAFRLPRPKSEPTHKGRGKERHRIRTWPNRKPDLDKLTRSVLDALTNVVWTDDSRVVRILATKDWGSPGVKVQIRRIENGGR